MDADRDINDRRYVDADVLYFMFTKYSHDSRFNRILKHTIMTTREYDKARANSEIKKIKHQALRMTALCKRIVGIMIEKGEEDGMRPESMSTKLANVVQQYNDTVRRMVRTDVSWVMMAWLGLDIVGAAREAGMNVVLDRDTNIIEYQELQDINKN